MSGKALQQSEVQLPDDSSFFMDEHGSTMHLTYVQCDVCGAEVEASRRWNVWSWARGSGYWAQVMWTCAPCGPTTGAQPPSYDPYEGDYAQG